MSPLQITACVFACIILGLASLAANCWSTKHKKHWASEMVLFFSIPGSIVGLLLLALFSIPVSVLVSLWQSLCERRFMARLKEHGRYIDNSQLEKSLNLQGGTLIIEQAQKLPARVWWTTDDVRSMAPCEIPAEDNLDYLHLDEPHPFVLWCERKYTSESTGSGILTDAPGHPPGFMKAGFLQSLFPASQVVATVRQHVPRLGPESA